MSPGISVHVDSIGIDEVVVGVGVVESIITRCPGRYYFFTAVHVDGIGIDEVIVGVGVIESITRCPGRHWQLFGCLG